VGVVIMKKQKIEYIRALSYTKRKLKILFRKLIYSKYKIKYIKSDFLFFPLINNAIVVDVGCGHEAEFAITMINKYNANSVIIDPTIKHKPQLDALVEKYQGKLKHYPYLLSKENGTIDFSQPKNYESGSILDDHVNSKREDTLVYKVQSINLDSLIKLLNVKHVDIIKLDLEGAEYELFKDINITQLNPFKQIFIEFHHHAIERYTLQDTKNIVTKLKSFGYKEYSLDDHNYLFKK
jgi:FkbM family methyltransferase